VVAGNLWAAELAAVSSTCSSTAGTWPSPPGRIRSSARSWWTHASTSSPLKRSSCVPAACSVTKSSWRTPAMRKPACWPRWGDEREMAAPNSLSVAPLVAVLAGTLLRVRSRGALVGCLDGPRRHPVRCGAGVVDLRVCPMCGGGGTAEAGGRQVNLLEAVMGPAAIPARLWGTAWYDGPGSSSRLCGWLAWLKSGFDASNLVSGSQKIGPER
jgi:hypothetical protein